MEKLTYVKSSPQKSSATVTKIIRDKKQISIMVSLNKAYYANAKLIKSIFLKKSTKMEICKTTIRPVGMYSSQTWTF